MVSQDHLQLTAVVKGLHAELRCKYKDSKNNEDEIWKEHCKNTDKLKEYSKAMHQLATQHWPQNSECRIHWCQTICLEYFLQEGLQKALEKDSRRENHKKLHNSEEFLANMSLFTKQRKSEDLIKLLDVGSCYNPFGQIPGFFSVAVDLCPAVPDVIQCDFLDLKVDECNSNTSEFKREECLKNLASPLKRLPRDSFDVVVFSLLLEYLPSQQQRWHCCKLAHQLLGPNGLLLIITPDSKHVNHRAKMIKSWKLAIESLGFSRWRYCKMTHIHCMAFRKLSSICCQQEVQNSEEMMYIPQDFQELTEEDEYYARNEEENQTVGSFFEELPQFPN